MNTRSLSPPPSRVFRLDVRPSALRSNCHAAHEGQPPVKPRVRVGASAGARSKDETRFTCRISMKRRFRKKDESMMKA